MDDAAPGTLLVQKCTAQAQSTPVTRRITDDGDVYELSDRVARVEGGRVVLDQVPREWRKKAHLSADGVDKVRGALRATGFLDLAPVHEPKGVVSDGTDVTWTARLDGHEKTVTVHGLPATEVPALTQLDDVFEDVVADALDAASG